MKPPPPCEIIAGATRRSVISITLGLSPGLQSIYQPISPNSIGRRTTD